MNLKALLNERVEAALAACNAPGEGLVQSSARAEFGDYQANGVMAAAKRAGKKPRELANEVVSALDLKDIASQVEIAGPGFINITLAPSFLAGRISAATALAPTPQPLTVVVDYSAPNLAKRCMWATCAAPSSATRWHAVCSTRPPGCSAKSRRRLGHPVRHAAHLYAGYKCDR